MLLTVVDCRVNGNYLIKMMDFWHQKEFIRWWQH